MEDNSAKGDFLARLSDSIRGISHKISEFVRRALADKIAQIEREIKEDKVT